MKDKDIAIKFQKYYFISIPILALVLIIYFPDNLANNWEYFGLYLFAFSPIMANALDALYFDLFYLHVPCKFIRSFEMKRTDYNLWNGKVDHMSFRLS